MEIHWGQDCQLYVTPISAGEVCVVLISRDQRLRLDEALPRFPEVARRLGAAGAATLERGGVSASRRLKAVYRDNVALVGDASGSVDAITAKAFASCFSTRSRLPGRLKRATWRNIRKRTGGSAAVRRSWPISCCCSSTNVFAAAPSER